MVGRRWLSLSLARKMSVLFGTAVLLIIAVTLLFPWVHMSALTEQVMLLRAKRVATAAYQSLDLRSPDWHAAQRRLDEHWPVLRDELDLPPDAPRLVSADWHGPGFQRDALDRLTTNPRQQYHWRLQRDGRLFRFARAVRGTDLDPYGHVLRGIIDVQLPMPEAPHVWNAAITLLAGASGAMLALLIFYMVIQRLVLSPLHELRRVAEKVTSGDLNVRATVRGRDEFQDLSQAFNEMLAHLKAAQEEQERINRSLDVRLGELAEVNVALYESSRIKSEFLANVTHELRTPLVSIIGFAELLRDATESAEPDRQRVARYAGNILTSGRNLLDLINDLLDLTRIEAGQLQLHVSVFEIADLCRDLVDFLRPLADKRDQNLTLDVAEGIPTLSSDVGRIRQILFNLLSNAIKFTPVGGAIGLHVTPGHDGFVRLSVTDTGPGIAPEDRERVFQKFQQLDASSTREHTGTGLGLAITHDLVDLLGGTISLESEPGQGATFTVVLPVIAEQTVNRPRIPLT